MSKKALLVDTNFSAIPIYEYLVSLGLTVYVIGRNPQDFMAKSVPNYIEMDYSAIDNLTQVINDLAIDYLIPGCNDHSYSICSQLADKSYCCNIDDAQTTAILLDKAQFRAFAYQYHLSVPQTFTRESAVLADHQLIVKPVDAFSGKGVTHLVTITQESIDQAIDVAKSCSKTGQVVIEEFVQGQLYSHTAFLQDQAIIQDFIVEEYGSANPFVVDTSFVKTDFPELLLTAIRNEIESIAKILTLKDGLIHTQFIAQDGRFWLIEMTRRCPGDLYSQLIELSTNYQYAENYTRAFIGEVLQPWQKTEIKPIVRHTITQQKSGIFKHLSFNQAVRLERYVSIATNGDFLQPSPSGRVGILFMLANSLEEQHELVNKCLQRSLYQVNFIAEGDANA